MNFLKFLNNRTPIQIHQDNIKAIFDFIKKYSLIYENNGAVNTNSIDPFIKYLYILINISNDNDFDYIRELYITKGVTSLKQVTLKGYNEYLTSNPNPQDNLDELINFIIDNKKKYYNSNIYDNIPRPNIQNIINHIINIKKTDLEIKDEKTLSNEKLQRQKTQSSDDGYVSRSVYGGNNKQYKEILGKRRRIYKIKGSRKEHVKYKGELIPVSDYKKLVKK